MSDIILDSGIFIASVFPETLSLHADKLLMQVTANGDSLHAPILLRYEMVAVARKAVYQQRVTPAQGIAARNEMLNYAISLYFDDTLLKRAYELATKFKRPTAYDAQYLALAEHLSCDFWTTDERLYNAIKDDFQQIHWLGSITV